MDLLRTIWPTPFNVKKGNIVSLIVQLVIFLVVCTIASWLLISVLGRIAIIGWLFRLLGSLMDIYSVVGIVLCVCCFLGVTSK